MKLCTKILVRAFEGNTVTDFTVVEVSVVDDDHTHPSLGHPVEIGDVLFIIGDALIVGGPIDA